jgi:hypothetical protein
LERFAVNPIAELYTMARKAEDARLQLKEATNAGDPLRYHAILRNSPELKLAEPLKMARRVVATLTEERRRLPESMDPEVRRLQNEQIRAASEQVALGALMWATEALGGSRPISTEGSADA